MTSAERQPMLPDKKDRPLHVALFGEALSVYENHSTVNALLSYYASELLMLDEHIEWQRKLSFCANLFFVLAALSFNALIISSGHFDFNSASVTAFAVVNCVLKGVEVKLQLPKRIEDLTEGGRRCIQLSTLCRQIHLKARFGSVDPCEMESFKKDFNTSWGRLSKYVTLSRTSASHAVTHDLCNAPHTLTAREKAAAGFKLFLSKEEKNAKAFARKEASAATELARKEASAATELARKEASAATELAREEASAATEVARKEASAGKEFAAKEAKIAGEVARKEAVAAKELASKDAGAAKEFIGKEAVAAKELAVKEANAAKEFASKEAIAAKELAAKTANAVHKSE